MQTTIPKAPKYPEKAPFLFGGGKEPKKFEVRKYLTLSDMAQLLTIYFDTYLGVVEEGEEEKEPILDGFVFRAFRAQVDLDVNLLKIATNANVESKQFDIDDLYGTEFLSVVKSHIKNWDIFMYLLEDYKSMLKEDTFSLKTTISSAISAFVSLDQKTVDKMAKTAKDAIEELKGSAVGALAEEGMK